MTTTTKKFQDIRVPAPGFNAMGMSAFYGAFDDETSKKTLRRAIEIGCTFWDTADMYGCGSNEELLGSVLNEPGNREKVFLATKFGNDFDRETRQLNWQINGKPDYARSSLDESLKRLNLPYVDLYYLHRVDPNVPIEETVAAMEEGRKAGKCKYLGISECSAETLRRASKVAKIDAVQTEYSPWTMDIEENGLLQACRELGVALVAYSPLGRGFLTGKYRSPEDFEEGDFRRMTPRFSKENFPKNLELVKRIEDLAKEKGCTPAQLTLAWLMYQGDDIIPIPGTKSIKYLEENFGATRVKVTEEDDKKIREIIKQLPPSGTRYPESHMHTVHV